jgi:hypothetical protein
VWELKSGVYNNDGTINYSFDNKKNIINNLTAYYRQKYNNRYYKTSKKFNKQQVHTSKH